MERVDFHVLILFISLIFISVTKGLVEVKWSLTGLNRACVSDLYTLFLPELPKIA